MKQRTQSEATQKSLGYTGFSPPPIKNIEACDICEIPFGFINAKKRQCDRCKQLICENCILSMQNQSNDNKQIICDLCALREYYKNGEQRKQNFIQFNLNRRSLIDLDLQKLQQESYDMMKHNQELKNELSLLQSKNSQQQIELIQNELSNLQSEEKALHKAYEEMMPLKYATLQEKDSFCNNIQRLNEQNNKLEYEIKLLTQKIQLRHSDFQLLTELRTNVAESGSYLKIMRKSDQHNKPQSTIQFDYPIDNQQNNHMENLVTKILIKQKSAQEGSQPQQKSKIFQFPNEKIQK